MTKEAQVAAFEGGKLRLLACGVKSREVVLALPLSRLLVKVVRVPPDEDPVAVSEPILKALSPFPDESLTVGCETVSNGEKGRVVIAAALPESATDDIGEALDAEGLSVVRIDSLALGQLRGVWSALGESAGRRLVLFDSPDCLSCIVLDGGQPSAIRAITDRANLWREVMLSLLEAENFGGAQKVGEIVVVKSEEAESAPPQDEGELSALSSFAPVREIRVGEDASLVGVAERAADEDGLNALPASWREFLEETRFKRKFVKCMAVAGGLWVLVMAVLFGVPVAYGFMTDHQKTLSRQHQRQYAAVKEMKAKVDLIHKYSDHARGALEIMKALSDRLPDGVTLSSWSYRRDSGVHVAGDAETSEAVYAFKDAMDEMADGEDGEGERIFGSVGLNGPSASRGGWRFDLDCQYQQEEEE